METHRRLKGRLEWIWWLFTIALVALVLLPLWINEIQFPFYLANILFIAIFVTATRYIFLLKHTWLAQNKWVKYIIIALGVVSVFVIVTLMGDFNNYLEEVGLQEVVNHMHASRQYAMIRYIQGEMLFFGVGSAVAVALLPFRMIMSIWRIYNQTGKV